MREEVMALQRLDHRGHPVMPPDPEVVPLRHVVGEHHPRALTDPGQHGEQDTALQRLRLVDDDEGVVQAPAADVGQRQDLQQAREVTSSSTFSCTTEPRVSKTAWAQGDIFSDSEPGR